MVRAILEGRKTQTRRVIKPQPPEEALDAGCLRGSGPDDGLWTRLDSKDLLEAGIVGDNFRCPYGVEGDRLWVREAFQPLFAEGIKFRDANWQTGEGYAIRYVATDGRTEWMDQDDNITDRCKPGIHMPRWASRLALEIAKVRVERVQEISEEDAIAEGISDTTLSASYSGTAHKTHGRCKLEYASLWDHLNAKRGFAWDTNPWVWVLEFRSERVSAGDTQK
jgi:hypothetical protein